MPRLGYTKSRTGCRRCRQRRVKCDEKQPCSACVRHKLVCSLTETTSSKHPLPSCQRQDGGTRHDSLRRPANAEGVGFTRDSSLSIQQPGSSSNRSLCSATLSPRDFLRYISRFVIETNTSPRVNTNWATDMELMHHYTTSTSLSFPRADDVSHIWQLAVVKLSFSNEPLLHQILATSAYHLAYLYPNNRHTYSILASQHQSDAAQGIRVAINEITPSSCHSIFAAASLLIIGAFAALSVGPEKGSTHPNFEDMLEIIILTKGMSMVLSTFEDIISQGPFADLFKLPTYTEPVPLMEGVCGKLKELRDWLENENIDQVAKTIIDHEILGLSQSIQQSIVSAPVPQLRVTMTWPISLSDGFLALLRRRDASALVLFVYYCLIVHQSSSVTWFTTGWGASVATNIERDLPARWRKYIEWPLDQIRDVSMPKE